MTRLYHAKGWNPFKVYVNDVHYELENICLYDATGVVASTGKGWFGDTNNKVETLTVPDVLLRRKVNFDGKPFIISRSRGLADLYVPVGFFGFTKEIIFEDHGIYAMKLCQWSATATDKINFVDRSKQEKVYNEAAVAKVKRLLKYAHAIERQLAPVREAIHKLDAYAEIESWPFDEQEDGLYELIGNYLEIDQRMVESGTKKIG